MAAIKKNLDIISGLAEKPVFFWFSSYIYIEDVCVNGKGYFQRMLLFSGCCFSMIQ